MNSMGVMVIRWSGFKPAVLDRGGAVLFVKMKLGEEGRRWER